MSTEPLISTSRSITISWVIAFHAPNGNKVGPHACFAIEWSLCPRTHMKNWVYIPPSW